MPSFTGDFFGPKHLGFNYGLVFIGWGLGFFMAQTRPAPSKIFTGSLNWAYWISAIILVIAALGLRCYHPAGTGKRKKIVPYKY